MNRKLIIAATGLGLSLCAQISALVFLDDSGRAIAWLLTLVTMTFAFALWESK